MANSPGNASVDKIKPNDPRVKRRFTTISGRKWSYLDALPNRQQRGVAVLIHGFPDISLGWRYQIPMLMNLGFRCIALDCMGYGETGTSPNLSDFSFKTHAEAVAGICAEHRITSIIIGGHDWGGAVVFRVAQWYPDLVSHVFSVCTPYFPVVQEFRSTEALVAGALPQFGYQLQFGSEDGKVERVVTDEGRVRKFLLGMYGGKPQSRKAFMTPERGIDLSLIEGDEIAMTPLLEEEEFDYYVSQFSKSGINGPCNWYRTRPVNFDDERRLPAKQQKGVEQPTLFIQALNDNILKPEMAKGMEKSIPNMTYGEVKAGHWALWQTPKETNSIIRNWIEGVVIGGKSKL